MFPFGTIRRMEGELVYEMYDMKINIITLLTRDNY